MGTQLTMEDVANMTTDEKITALFGVCLANSKKLEAIGDIRLEMNEFKEEVTATCDEMKKYVSTFQDRLTALEESQESHSSKTNKRFVLNELYDKRFNLLFHGIKDSNTEEDLATKTATAEYILEELLCIPNAMSTIKIVDTHRLPQKPVKLNRAATRNSRPVCRPVAIKLSCVRDVDLVFTHLKNLKEVYDTRDKNESIYCTKHLPREMQRQRKALMPKFRKAIKEEKEAKFFVDYKTGNYRLKVEGEYVQMPKLRPEEEE